MKQICNAIIFSINPLFHYEILHSGFKGSRSNSDAKNLRKSDQVIDVCKIFSVSFFQKKKQNLFSIWTREGMLHSNGLLIFICILLAVQLVLTTFIEHLLCTRHSTRCWKHEDE